MKEFLKTTIVGGVLFLQSRQTVGRSDDAGQVGFEANGSGIRRYASRAPSDATDGTLGPADLFEGIWK